VNVLLIGSGGREHALAWKLSQSPLLDKLYAAPGSDAIGALARRPELSAGDFPALARFCGEAEVGLVVVGPEAPLAAGIADALRREGITVFGPGKDAARLESSKSFAKDFMRRHGIPTAASRSHQDPDRARAALAGFGLPVVVKADGLAAGKGVRVCTTRAEAEAAIDDFLVQGAMGDAGSTVVIEEFLRGRETTILGFCDGTTFLPLPPSSDHKRLADGDAGPNTGGMGVFAPTPEADSALLERVRREVGDRVLKGLKADGLRFNGLLYCGLILTAEGPKVLEFNVRFGDPETQAVLPLLRSDLLELMLAASRAELAGRKVLWEGSSVTVVLASEGYPAAPRKGREIRGLDEDGGVDGVLVFHAGTKKAGGRWHTAGGRVLAVTATGSSIGQAREKAYAGASRIAFEGMQMRSDIARSVASEEEAVS